MTILDDILKTMADLKKKQAWITHARTAPRNYATVNNLGIEVRACEYLPDHLIVLENKHGAWCGTIDLEKGKIMMFKKDPGDPMRLPKFDLKPDDFKFDPPRRRYDK